MGSSRLPNKVLLPLGTHSVLAHVVRRLKQVGSIHSLVIATTEASADDAIVTAAQELNVGVFRGSENDVLSRYYEAAKLSTAEVIVRITADCPMIDPMEVDRVITAFLERLGTPDEIDYASNQAGTDRRIPHGQDVEVFSMNALTVAQQKATDPGDREHVTPYLYRTPGRFRTRLSHYAGADLSHLRLTLDTPADLQQLQAVVPACGDDASLEQIASYLEAHPEVVALNAHTQQKGLLSDSDQRRQRIAGRLLLGRADANSEIGFGHVSRLGALLTAWVEHGGRAMLLTGELRGAVRQRLVDAGVRIESIDERDSHADIQRSLVVAKESQAAAIAVDSYQYDRFQLERLRELFPTLSMDDLAEQGVSTDLVVNQNLNFPADRYGDVKPTRRLLVGAPYVLLRPEIRAALANATTSGTDDPDPSPRLLLSFGGSDPLGLTLPIVERLLPQLGTAKLIVMLGPGVSARTKAELAKQQHPALSLHEDVTNIVPLLRSATLALVAAGSTAWELCALAVPAMLVTVAKNQLDVASALSDTGAAVHRHWSGSESADEISASVLELLADGPQLQQLAQRAQKLIDGRGVFRVIDALLEVIDHRQAKP